MSHEATHDHSDDALRAAYGQRRGADGVRPRGPDCPTPDALLAAIRGEGDEPARLRTFDHALACAACRAELALLHGVSGVHDRRAAGRVVGHIGAWRRAVPVAAAATLVLAVGLAGVVRLQRASESPAARGEGTVRAGESELPLVAPGDGASVPLSAPVTFAWRAVPGAFRYTLELSTTDGTVVLSVPTTDTTLAAPLGATPGEYRWSVRAQGGDRSVRRSEARALQAR